MPKQTDDDAVTLHVRIPKKLHTALRKKRDTMSAKAGAEIAMPALIRSILEQATGT